MTRNTNDRRVLLELLLASLLLTLVIRYLWSYSLGNGDEMLFATGKQRFEIGQGSWAQWGEFFTWIWTTHNGRTADWLSGAIYFFGANQARWSISVLSSISTVTMVWCLYKLHSHLHPNAPFALGLATTCSAAFLFPFGATSLRPLVNLTMYSAAVCNYLIPTTLTLLALTLVVTSTKTSRLYLAGALGSLTATMHEQSALFLAMLAVLLITVGPKHWSLRHRIAGSAIVLVGVAQMFLSPGLHAKLRLVSSASTEQVSIVQKVLTTFYAFGVYYPILGGLISLVVATYLVGLIRSSTQVKLNAVLLTLLVLSTTAWAFSIAITGFNYLISSQMLNGLACLLMSSTWLLALLLHKDTHIRFGAVFVALAAASLAIPAASGYGAVRVFNFSILFLVAFIVWAMFAFTNTTSVAPNLGTHVFQKIKKYALWLTVSCISIYMIASATVAFRANFEPGVAQLSQQHAQCEQAPCAAKDPTLPNPRAFSGYGDHDYADTRTVLDWIER